MKFISLFILLISFITSGFGQAKPESQVFEMIMFGSRPGIKVYINGKGPFNFLIDTGADGFGRIDSATAESLGVKPFKVILDGDKSGKTTSVNQIQVDSLRLGNISFKKLILNSRNYNPSKKVTGYHMDGILGFNLFKEYLLTLDYPGKRVTIKKGALQKPDGQTVIPFQTPDNTPEIMFSIGPLLISADIDTGDSEGISLPEWLAKLLPSDTIPKIIGTGKSLTSTYTYYESKISVPVKLAKYIFYSPVIVYTSVFNNCNLGSSWLNNFSITFDQRNKLVKFEK